MNTRYLSRKSLSVIVVTTFLLGAALIALTPLRSKVRADVQVLLAHTSRPANQPFPRLDQTHFTDAQKQIVALTKSAYQEKPISFDKYVLSYTQGNEEAWCADFASWIYMKAGMPFQNPSSGNWRIPGVYSLKEYFIASHHYHKAGTYIPQVGDIAVYSHGQGHAAIVLAIQRNMLITIGGNESGRMRIDSRPIMGTDNYDLDGFGSLN